VNEAAPSDHRFAALCANCRRGGPWVVPSHAATLGRCHRAAMVKAIESGWRMAWLTGDHAKSAILCGHCLPDFDEADPGEAAKSISGESRQKTKQPKRS
jgi:hypothetical protein